MSDAGIGAWMLGRLARLAARLERLSRPAAAGIALVWMAGISGLSSLPARDLESVGAGGLLTNLAHAPVFALLGMWYALALPRAAGGVRFDRLALLRVVALVAAFGLVDETHQLLADRGRDFSVLDLGTDATGALCLLLVAAYVRRDGARGGGLWLRLAAGVVACVAAAAVATWLPACWAGVSWL